MNTKIIKSIGIGVIITVLGYCTVKLYQHFEYVSTLEKQNITLQKLNDTYVSLLEEKEKVLQIKNIEIEKQRQQADNLDALLVEHQQKLKEYEDKTNDLQQKIFNLSEEGNNWMSQTIPSDVINIINSRVYQ